MLQLSAMIIQRPVMSLRTGKQVARTTGAIINPNNLKVEGFYCVDDRKRQLILLEQDIRDVLLQGFVVNDLEALTEPKDLVRLKNILNLKFELIGKRVETGNGRKLGKVADYATEVSSMFIQKIYVTQSLFQNFNGGNLSVDRSQIIEITDKKIVINDVSATVPAGARVAA